MHTKALHGNTYVMYINVDIKSKTQLVHCYLFLYLTHWAKKIMLFMNYFLIL